MGTSNDYHPGATCWWLRASWQGARCAQERSTMGSHGVRAQFRRTRQLFRSPAAADCQDDTKLAGPGSASELEASRLQGSGDSHGTIRAAQDRNGGALGALLHPQDDRMALGPRADDSARPLREELRRGARLHAAAAGDRSSALRSTAGKGLRRWRRVARASSLARRLRKGYLRWTSECAAPRSWG
jgi:hypothetical protein